MRLFLVLPFLSLLFGASASSLDSRRPDAHPLDARDVSNVCAVFNAEEVPPGLSLILSLLGLTSQFNGPLSQSIPSILNDVDRFLLLSV